MIPHGKLYEFVGWRNGDPDPVYVQITGQETYRLFPGELVVFLGWVSRIHFKALLSFGEVGSISPIDEALFAQMFKLARTS